MLLLIFVLMLVLHQDTWLWDDATVVLGFIPWGLFYHACFSVAVAVLAGFAICFAWPHELERWADEKVSSDPPQDPPSTA